MYEEWKHEKAWLDLYLLLKDPQNEGVRKGEWLIASSLKMSNYDQ